MQYMGSVTISNNHKIKDQLVNYARSFVHAVVLDSNSDHNLPNTIAPATYDLIAGFSSSTNKNDFISSFHDLESITTTNQNWYLGYLGYDLKNNIENLYSKNEDALNWPNLHFFKPQLLFVLQNKELKVYSSINTHTLQDIIESVNNSLAPFGTNNIPTLLPKLSKQEYVSNVGKIIKHIQRGDIYEMNYCIEFSACSKIDPYKHYIQLINKTPSPFAAFLKNKHHFLLSASPERFLQKKSNTLISQPIKGTSPRSKNHTDDNRNYRYLKNSLKERTENIMITDLVRNDLSKIAMKQSVKVDELCGIYAYPHVYQMISTISAQIEDISFKDIIQATFPMGSMTGAPKIAAMKLIEKYENMKRGLYSGAVGYIAPGMEFDFNVVIRSLQYHSKSHYLSYIAGSAITALSNAEDEYEECLLKAYAINPK